MENEVEFKHFQKAKLQDRLNVKMGDLYSISQVIINKM